MGWKIGAARDLPIVEQDSWDGAAAKERVFTFAGWTENANPSKARRAFLFYNSDADELKGSYKCPFADVVDGTLKASSAGIKAAKSRIASTDVPEALKKRAQTILDSYASKMGMCSDDDDDDSNDDDNDNEAYTDNDDYLKTVYIIKKEKKEHLMLPFNLNSKTGIATLSESFVIPQNIIPNENKLYLAEAEKKNPSIIYPMFHALRAERVTRNRTFYMEETLRGNVIENTGMYSLIRPYPVPFIKDHATGGGMFGGEASDIYGRIVQAFMIEGALDNAKALSVVIGVADPYAIQKIMEGSWRTVSMGSRAEELYCSICNNNLTESPCEHDMDSEGFYVKIGPRGWRAMELSAVTVPSDPGALIQSTNLTREEFRMYASDPSRESVYDVSDPLRKNLLEHDEAGEYSIAKELYNDSRWLLKEFAAQRKRYTIFAESERSQKEASMTDKTKIVSIPQHVIEELQDEAFGVVYTDEASRKRIRRFPMFAEMTEEQINSVKEQIATAKDLTPDQREALVSRIDSEERKGETIAIAITAENYTHLFDVIDEMQIERDVLTTEAVVEQEEEAGNSTEEAQESEAAKVVAEENVDNTEITELQGQLNSERKKRTELLASVIARKQFVEKDSITRGKTVEQLVEFYQNKDVAVLETLYEMLEETLTQEHVDVDQVEHVETPLSQPVSSDVVEKETSQKTEEEDPLGVFLRFGIGGHPKTATAPITEENDAALL